MEPFDRQALIDKLEEAGVQAEVIESVVNAAEKKHNEEILTNISKYVADMFRHESMTEFADSFQGESIRFDVNFTAPEDEDDDTQVSVDAKMKGGSRTSKANRKGGSSRAVVVDGQEYPSSAAAARALDLDYEGRSAWRVLNRAQKEGVVDSLERVG